jgi:hypothetical protein
MTDFITRAQLAMLADALGVETERVAHLARLGAAGVRELRERISNVLFDEHAATFARVSKLAPLAPNALVAKVSEAAIPPLVAGRAAGALGVDHQGRIADLLSRLSPRYMADCAPHLDPRTLAVLAPIVPGDVLVPAAKELLRRCDYVTAARFVEFATPDLIRAFEESIDDDLGLLHTAALTYSTEQLADIIGAIPEARLDRIMLASLTTPESIVAGLSVLARLGPDLRAQLSEMLARHVEPGTRDAVLNAIESHGMTDDLHAVAEHALAVTT